jgi:hypothetical protein
MNETGSYPGQPWLWLWLWLWLYQLWYHVPGWRNSDNIDLIAIYMTGLATLLLLLVPFIPGPARHPPLDPGAPAHLALARQVQVLAERTPADCHPDRDWPAAGRGPGGCGCPVRD